MQGLDDKIKYYNIFDQTRVCGLYWHQYYSNTVGMAIATFTKY